MSLAHGTTMTMTRAFSRAPGGRSSGSDITLPRSLNGRMEVAATCINLVNGPRRKSLVAGTSPRRRRQKGLLHILVGGADGGRQPEGASHAPSYTHDRSKVMGGLASSGYKVMGYGPNCGFTGPGLGQMRRLSIHPQTKIHFGICPGGGQGSGPST